MYAGGKSAGISFSSVPSAVFQRVALVVPSKPN
jgi:hypothetical protein